MNYFLIGIQIITHLSIYQNTGHELQIYAKTQNSDFYSNKNEAQEDNKFSDRSVRFHQEYNGVNKHKISTGFQENFSN